LRRSRRGEGESGTSEMFQMRESVLYVSETLQHAVTKTSSVQNMTYQFIALPLVCPSSLRRDAVNDAVITLCQHKSAR
jgi:hypothetical protein